MFLAITRYFFVLEKNVKVVIPLKIGKNKRCLLGELFLKQIDFEPFSGIAILYNFLDLCVFDVINQS